MLRADRRQEYVICPTAFSLEAADGGELLAYCKTVVHQGRGTKTQPQIVFLD
jgi:hypothetical protein